MAAICTGNYATGGSGQYLLRSSIAGSPNLRASHTIMVRMKHTQTSTSIVAVPACLLQSSADNGTAIGRNGTGVATDLKYWRGTGATVGEAGTCYGNTTTWYHLTFVYNATTAQMRFYIDGTFIEQTASATTTSASSTNNRFIIGWMPGKYADAAMFDRALTDGEVAAMAAHRECQVTSGLLAFYRLDSDGSDSSGNSQTFSAGGTGTAVSYSTSDNPPQPETPIHTCAGAITTAATLAGAPNLIRNQAGAVSAAVTLAGTPNRILGVAGAWTPAVTFAGTPNRILRADGAFATAVTLAGAPNIVQTAAGAMTAAVTLAGDPGHTFGAAGAVAAAVTFAGAPNLVRTAAGEVSTAVTFAGAPNIVQTAAGAMTAAVTFSGTPNLVFNAAGEVSATITLAGDADLDVPATDAAGDITAVVTMAADPQHTFAVAGAMTAEVIFASMTGLVIDAAGEVTTVVTFEGAADLWHNAAGDITASATLAGDAVQVFGAAGAISTAVSFAGAPNLVLDAAGAVAAVVALAGDVGHEHAAAGAIDAVLTLAGAVTTDVDFTGRRFTEYANYNTATWNFDASLDWSVCGWVYIVESAGSGNQGDVFYSEDTSNPGNTSAIRIGYTSDVGSAPALRFRVPGLNLTHPIVVDEYYHCALTYDGTTARAYVDGVEIGNATVSATFTHNRVDLGSFHFNDDVVAEVAQVKSWLGHCLSVGELADEMAYWEPQTATADVVAWWQLRNPAPTLDSSGNGYTLVEVGFAPDLPGEIPVPGQLAPETVYDVAGAITAAATLSGDPGHVFGATGAVASTLTLGGSVGQLLGAAGAISASVVFADVVQITKGAAGAMAATVTLAGAAQHSVATLPDVWFADPAPETYAAHSVWVSDSDSGAEAEAGAWVSTLTDSTSEYASHSVWISE